MTTDTERINWIERTGANVIPGVSESLVPVAFSVCVDRVTGWHTAPKIRDAIDAAMREQQTTHSKLNSD